MEEKAQKQAYELSYLLLSSIAEDKLGDTVGKLKAAVQKAGGEVFAEEAPVQIDLAYTMTKTVGASRYVVNEAYIGWVKFDLPDEARALAGAEHPVEEVKNAVTRMDEVVRFLLIKAPRETFFTFAKAKEALEKENEPLAPEEVVEVKEVAVE